MRNYKLKDSELLELADTFHVRFTEDIASFSGFDKELNQDFADSLQAIINSAMTIGEDTTNTIYA